MPNTSPDTHGWTAVPRSSSAFLADCSPKDTKPVKAEDIKLPTSEVAQKTLAYEQKHLSEPTFNHSLRVYHYGTASHPYCLPTMTNSCKA
jgi:cyanamide hydratase